MTHGKKTNTRQSYRRRLLIMAAVFAAVLVIVATAGLWRLNQGPLSLNFLEPHLSWPLGSAADSLRLTVYDPVLTWGGWLRPVDLQAGPVVITDLQDRTVVEVEQVSLGLAWLDLLKKKVSLTRIEVRSTHMRLLRTEDGRFVAGFETKDKLARKPQNQSNEAFQEYLKNALMSPEPIPPFNRLTSISITGSRATIDDRKLDREWGIPELNLHLRRRGTDLSLSVDGIVDLEVQQTELRVSGVFDRVKKRFRSTISVRALRPSSIARFVPAVEKLDSVDIPIDVVVETDVSMGGEIHSADVYLRSKIGNIDASVLPTEDGGLAAQGNLSEIRLSELSGLVPLLESFTEPVEGTVEAALSSSHLLETAGFQFTTDMGLIGGTLVMNPNKSADVQLTLTQVQPWKLATLAPDLDGVRIQIDAQAEARLTAERSFESLLLSLTGSSGTVVIPEVHAQPFDLVGLSIQASATDNLATAQISDLNIQLPGLSIGASANATRGKTFTRITADASLSTFEASRIDQYWPSTLVPDVLEWISTNITAGSVRGAKVHAELSLPSDFSGPVGLTDLRGSFAFDDLTVAYLAPMPAATGVTGTATFTDTGFDFDVSGGAVQDIGVQTATVGIAPLSGSTRLSVDAQNLTGPVTTAIAAISGPPLQLIGEGLPQSQQFSGSAVTHLILDVPLSGSDPVPISVSGTSKLANVGLQGWLEGYELTRGDLELHFDMENLDVHGTARVNDVQTTFQWHEDLTGGTTPRTITASTQLDDAGRQAMGIPQLSQITGPLPLTVDLTGRADGSMAVNVDGDLSDTGLEFDQLGWSKPPGTPGRLTAEVVIGPDWSVTADPFRVAAGDLRANGSVRVDPKFSALRSLEISDLLYGDNRVSCSLERGPGGVWDLSFTGSRLDIGPLLSRSDNENPQETADAQDPTSNGFTFPAFTAEVTLEELFAGTDRLLGRFAGSAKYDGAVFVFLRTDLEVAPGNIFKIRIEPGQPTGHDVVVTAADAGEVLSALLPRVELEGGALEIKGHRTSRDQPVEGTFRLEDYVVRESTNLTRLLQVASIGGALDALAGEGISFKTLQADFSIKRPVVKVSKFRTTGSSLGVTADGTVDFSTGLVDFKGAVVPASRIQRLLGKIPGLGIILAGTKGEGLLAVNYHLYGPNSKPKIDVNPLSGLTPGILRDMFRIPDAAEGSDKATSN